MQVRTRVLIVDDRSRSRKGLSALLSTSEQMEVVGEARNGKEAVALVEEFQPDVIVMDARMPVMNGIEATRTIKDRWPEIRIIVLSMYRTYFEDAQQAGADSFLEKGCPPQDILKAILDQ